MTDGWPVEEGSFALKLMITYIRHQVTSGELSAEHAEEILRNALDGVPDGGLRARIQNQFPDLNIRT